MQQVCKAGTERPDAQLDPDAPPRVKDAPDESSAMHATGAPGAIVVNLLDRACTCETLIPAGVCKNVP